MKCSFDCYVIENKTDALELFFENMTYYPIIIPTLNRYQHFKYCIESLAACTYADKTELVIGLDYPPAEKYVEGWKLIKEYIPTIKGFAKVTVFAHDHNLGAVENIVFLRGYVSARNDAWIATEDDNVFAPAFLEYMDKCLEKYKDDESVLCVSGCLEPQISEILFNDLNKAENTVIKLTGLVSAYGLGHWSKKEELYRKNWPKDFLKYIYSSRIRILKLLKCPAKLERVYYWIKNNPSLNRSCDFTREAWEVLNNKVTVYPSISLVRNNGYDGSGLHCGDDNELALKWSNLVLPSQINYEIIDKLSKNDIGQLSKKVFKSYDTLSSKNSAKVIIRYLIFGYNLSIKIESVSFMLKEIIAKSSFWKRIKNKQRVL